MVSPFSSAARSAATHPLSSLLRYACLPAALLNQPVHTCVSLNWTESIEACVDCGKAYGILAEPGRPSGVMPQVEPVCAVRELGCAFGPVRHGHVTTHAFLIEAKSGGTISRHSSYLCLHSKLNIISIDDHREGLDTTCGSWAYARGVSAVVEIES